MFNGVPGWKSRFQPNGRLTFLKGFLRHPTSVGSITPSSRFLERRIVAGANIARTRMVVELGPGTGGTTRAILNALPPSARLLTLEIDPDFVEHLKSFSDPRLCVRLGSADRICEALSQDGFPRPDAVVSGIPFSTMPPAAGRRILHAIWDCLRPGGCFLAYQFMGRVAELASERLGPPEVELELLNLPPVHLYRWRKPREAAPSTGLPRRPPEPRPDVS
jgi:phosphatidylethanolamine/phosphatidyl-N-methylethanolamine N-methyltransferase